MGPPPCYFCDKPDYKSKHLNSVQIIANQDNAGIRRLVTLSTDKWILSECDQPFANDDTTSRKYIVQLSDIGG